MDEIERILGEVTKNANAAQSDVGDMKILKLRTLDNLESMVTLFRRLISEDASDERIEREMVALLEGFYTPQNLGSLDGLCTAIAHSCRTYHMNKQIERIQKMLDGLNPDEQ